MPRSQSRHSVSDLAPERGEVSLGPQESLLDQVRPAQLGLSSGSSSWLATRSR